MLGREDEERKKQSIRERESNRMGQKRRGKNEEGETRKDSVLNIIACMLCEAGGI